jgi:hypothetical protein
MVCRVRIGAHPALGDTGMFISRPGDDVNSPSHPLLVDSRFDSMQIHAFDRVRIPGTNSAQIRTWYGQWSFPALSYQPMFWFALINAGSDTAYYPLGTIEEINYYSYAGVRVDNSTITAAASTSLFPSGTSTGNQEIDLEYIIFKNGG